MGVPAPLMPENHAGTLTCGMPGVHWTYWTPKNCLLPWRRDYNNNTRMLQIEQHSMFILSQNPIFKISLFFISPSLPGRRGATDSEKLH